jgi:hypothetical protein
MERNEWPHLIRELRHATYQFRPDHRVEFDAGLTNEEVQACEHRFGFRFPPDLRQFLQTALPSGPQFPDWRSGDERALREWLDQPRQGVLFDVEHNGFWLDEWGERPESLDDAAAIASDQVLSAPRLIPICSHRMMPDEPHLAGNPVLSVWQTDIIYYGFDLADYLRHEFRLRDRASEPKAVRPIRFWDVDRFQSIRRSRGPYVFDNSKGILP